MTPKTWPDLCAPTPEQWLAWFLEQEPDDQLVLAGQVLGFADEANRCFAADHDAAIAVSRSLLGQANARAELMRKAAHDFADQLTYRDREIRRLRVLNRRQDRLLTPRRLP